MSKKFSKDRRDAVGSSAAEVASKHKDSKPRNLRALFVLITLSISFLLPLVTLRLNRNLIKTLKKQTQTLIYRVGDKWGFCNSNKKMIIQPPIYNGAYPFSEGLAAA